MSKLNVNDIAPDFELPSTSGSNFRLSRDAENQPVILFFYPKDFTPGCTQEACSFRDSYEQFTYQGILVVGISQDSMKQHLKFKEKHSLPYDLLSDPNGNVAGKYGARIPIIGANKRVTFLLDKNHKIKHICSNLFGISKHIDSMRENIGELK